MIPVATSTATRMHTQAVPKRILVGDDQADVLEALRLLLKGRGYQTVVAESPSAVLRAADSADFDLILIDLNYARDTTSGQEGLDLLASLQARHNSSPVIVMTAWGSIDLAVEAMRRGARDFVQKPWDNARLLATLEKQMEEASDWRDEQRRSQSEMEIARKVQEKLFPQRTKRLQSLDYYGACVAAYSVSGDYYDFLDLGEGSLGFVLADVSGKGVPAALLMANLQACFRSQTELAFRDPSALLRTVNHLFYSSTPAEHFATLFFGVYDDRSGGFRYVNCGHPAPVLIRANERVEQLQPTATVLGAFATWNCTEAEVTLRAGDTLLLFTDGIMEAGIAGDDEFGVDRISAFVGANQHRPLETLVHDLINAASSFGSGAADDLTVVALRGR